MLCAGGVRRSGWKTLDVKGGDYTAMIPPLPSEVMNTPWDEVELIHGITSFYPWDAHLLLRDVWRCLREGGKLVLEQPDFTKAKEKVEWLFGDGALIDPMHMNKWAYTPGTLVEALRNVGFKKDITIHPAQHHVPSRDFRLEAIK